MYGLTVLNDVKDEKIEDGSATDPFIDEVSTRSSELWIAHPPLFNDINSSHLLFLTNHQPTFSPIETPFALLWNQRRWVGTHALLEWV